MEQPTEFNCPVCQTKIPFGQKICPVCQSAIYYRNLSEDYWNERKRKMLRQTSSISDRKTKR